MSIGNFAGRATVFVGADIREYTTKLAKAAQIGAKFVAQQTTLGRLLNAKSLAADFDTGRLEQGLNTLKGSALQLGAALSTVGVGLTAVGAAGAAGIGLAARRFAELDAELRTVAGITDASEQQFDALTDTVRRLGRTTTFTSVEVAQAAKELARGGQSVEQIQKSLRSVLLLARGTGTGLDESAAAVVRTLGQFRLGVEESARVVDVLAKAANSGTFVLEDLGESLKFLGPIAESLGFELEEVSASFAVLANAGLRGGIAGRQLRRVFFELTNAQKLQRLETELGVKNLVTAEGEFRSLAVTIRKIQEGLRGLSSQQRVNIVEEIFGEGAAAFEGLAKSVDDIDKVTLSLLTAEGSAQKLTDRIEGGLKGEALLALSAFTDAAIQLGETLTPLFSNVLDVITDLSQGAVTIIREYEGVIRVLTAIGAVLGVGGAVILGTTALAAGIVALTTAATFAAPVFGFLISLITPFAGIVAAATASVVLLTAAYVDLNNQASKKALREASLGNAVSEIDSLARELEKLTEANNEVRLDPKGFDKAKLLVEELEKKVGDLGIEFDEATGKVGNLEKAFAKFDELRSFEIAREKAQSLRDEVREKREEIAKILEDPTGGKLGGEFRAARKVAELNVEINKLIEGPLEAAKKAVEQQRENLKKLGIEVPGPVKEEEELSEEEKTRRDNIAKSAKAFADAGALLGVANRAIRESISENAFKKALKGADTSLEKSVVDFFRALQFSPDVRTASRDVFGAIKEGGLAIGNLLVSTSEALQKKVDEELTKKAEEVLGRVSSLQSALRPADLGQLGTDFASNRLSQQSFDVDIKTLTENKKQSALLEDIKGLLDKPELFPVN